MRLEDKQMLEVEGGTEQWCLKILRHATWGTRLTMLTACVDAAAGGRSLARLRSPTPTLQPQPYSKNHVLHLGMWYAQSHPVEALCRDAFFAVWLRPDLAGGSQHPGGLPFRRNVELVRRVDQRRVRAERRRCGRERDRSGERNSHDAA